MRRFLLSVALPLATTAILSVGSWTAFWWVASFGLIQSSRRRALGSIVAASITSCFALLSVTWYLVYLEVKKRTRDLEAMRRRNLELEKQQLLFEANSRLLAERASTDGLTGAKSRRFLDEMLPVFVSFVSRRGLPMSMAMIDVDQFKGFNDTFGHLKGDDALRQIVSLLYGCVRMSDLVARWGGEEFAILLPAATADAARIVAERIRQTVESHTWLDRPITVSIGVATMHELEGKEASLASTADVALYRAKNDGRNRVVHAGDPIAALSSGLEAPGSSIL